MLFEDPASPQGQGNNPREVMNETQVSTNFVGAISKLPESYSKVYSSYTFKQSKTSERGFHVTMITTQL